MWEKIEKLKVEERMDSDHFPVAVWIKGGSGETRKRRGEEN